MRLTPNERKVLTYLVEEGCVESLDGRFTSFAPIIASTRLDRSVVRRACRSLKRKGLTIFERALWSDDGPAGSGYAASTAGAALIEANAPLPHRGAGR